MFCENCGTKSSKENKFCQNCGNKTEVDSITPVEYFAISKQRLILFSILTLGIYQIYWFYKNWKAVKKTEGQNGSSYWPFWRAVFAVFFCHSLFKKVLESAKSHAYQNPYSPGWLATGYILLLLISNGLFRMDLQDIGVWFVIVFLTFIPLLPVQKAINFNNGKINGHKELKKDFSGAEVAVIVFGIIWSLLIFIGMSSS